MSEAGACEICRETIAAGAKRCARCNKLVRGRRGKGRNKADKAARVRALQASWREGGFRCHYTGILLEEKNHRSPRYLSFDHRTPRDESDIVIAAQMINDMKSDLAEDEFRRIVVALTKHFAGEPFDEDSLNLVHFRR